MPKEFIETFVEPPVDLEHPPFDAGALHAKYSEEREKRIRPDANEQYVNASEHNAYLADPWAEPVERVAVDDEVDVVRGRVPRGQTPSRCLPGF